MSKRNKGKKPSRRGDRIEQAWNTGTAGKTSKPLKVLLAHDNKTPGHTDKAHKLARKLENDPDYEIIHDQQVWSRGERTSGTETDRREREMVNEADVVARVVPPPSRTGSPRNEGALREARKAIRAGKPLVEIYERGAKTSPNRHDWEKNYGKRAVIRLQDGERLETGLKRGIKELKDKGIL